MEISIKLLSLVLLAISFNSYSATPENCFITKSINNNSVEITGYVCESKDVVIPEKINNILVTSIGDNAFAVNQLTSVVIPDSVMSIGAFAFRRNQLTSVDIPDSVTSIKKFAFFSNKLTSVDIPDSITSIETFAFYSNKLTSVDIPDSVTSIGYMAFADNQLTKISLTASLELRSSGFPEDFISFYDETFRQAGVYKFKDGVWIKL